VANEVGKARDVNPFLTELCIEVMAIEKLGPRRLERRAREGDSPVLIPAILMYSLILMSHALWE
jgi:uncharacterized membrane protein